MNRLKLVVNNKPKKPNWLKRNTEELKFALWILFGMGLLAYIVSKVG